MAEPKPRYIKVKVTPKSKTNEIKGLLEDGTMKISVKATPERGKANQAVIETLSEHFKIPESKIKIISGHTSQTKLIRIEWT